MDEGGQGQQLNNAERATELLMAHFVERQNTVGCQNQADEKEQMQYEMLARSQSPIQYHYTVDTKQHIYNLNLSKDMSSARDQTENPLERGNHGTTLDDINDEVGT